MKGLDFFFVFLIGEELTLYIILLNTFMTSPLSNEDLIAEIKGLFREKLALIPDTKLVITNKPLGNVWANRAIARETLEVYFSRDLLLATMLELLQKRWQTLDLISVMQEVNRTLAHHRFFGRQEVIVLENLSCIPRLQKVDKSLGQVVSKQE